MWIKHDGRGMPEGLMDDTRLDAFVLNFSGEERQYYDMQDMPASFFDWYMSTNDKPYPIFYRLLYQESNQSGFLYVCLQKDSDGYRLPHAIFDNERDARIFCAGSLVGQESLEIYKMQINAIKS